MSWTQAGWRALVIVLYFAIGTVLLPDAILGLGAVTGAASFVQDSIVTIVWALAMVAGLVGLRRAQDRGMI